MVFMDGEMNRGRQGGGTFVTERAAWSVRGGQAGRRHVVCFDHKQLISEVTD